MCNFLNLQFISKKLNIWNFSVFPGIFLKSILIDPRRQMHYNITPQQPSLQNSYQHSSQQSVELPLSVIDLHAESIQRIILPIVSVLKLKLCWISCFFYHFFCVSQQQRETIRGTQVCIQPLLTFYALTVKKWFITLY